MFITDLLTALIVATLIMLPLYLLGRMGPWSGWLWFALILFLFTWAGGAWVGPYGSTLWGILLPVLSLLRIDLCFFYGRGRTAKAAPYQAGSYRASPSGERSRNHNNRNFGCLFLDFSGGACHGAGVSLSEIANETKKH